MQENRSTDNMFHGLPGADIATSGIDSKGRTIPLVQMPLRTHYDLGHSHAAFLTEYDNGKMDGEDKVPISCLPPCPQDTGFAYVNPADVAPYFQMAETYAFADRMFQTNQGPSYGAHQYIISGTALTAPDSGQYVMDNPSAPGGGPGPVGCDAPLGTSVSTIFATGQPGPRVYTCFEHQTIADLLGPAHVSWAYYAPTGGALWTGPNSIQHLRFGPQWANVRFPQTAILTDIAAGRLANMTWVVPNDLSSDHSAMSDGTGPAWVASIVNAIGTSQYWNSTAIFITWDDWGGWYDHVPPPNIFNSMELGLRVPLIIVSPYVRPGYVSHVNHEFGSLLHFAESTWGLGDLGYSDARADDMSDCFNYLQTPIPFHVINSAKTESYFLHSHAVNRGPDDE
jgi:phospholipase C